ncbi:hypothetical protein [Echinicola shivajiensis]|uniref:hypothetical protein n=1 Tax=Echinicola shivajiensis TaxID=1035916 RepID=UPI001BFC2D86|nr:hypothetical protein [Echinicola shivajiensis]
MEYLDHIELIFVIIGGAWVVYNFYLKRDRYPKTVFNLEAKLFDQNHESWLFEFTANIENKGQVRHYIRTDSFILKIRYLTDKDLKNGLSNHTRVPCKGEHGQPCSEDLYLLNFPNTLKIKEFDQKNIYWLPRYWKYFYVDAQTEQQISLPLAIPKEARHLLISSKFRYKDKKSGVHSIQKVISIEDYLQKG